MDYDKYDNLDRKLSSRNLIKNVLSRLAIFSQDISTEADNLPDREVKITTEEHKLKLITGEGNELFSDVVTVGRTTRKDAKKLRKFLVDRDYTENSAKIVALIAEKGLDGVPKNIVQGLPNINNSKI